MRVIILVLWGWLGMPWCAGAAEDLLKVQIVEPYLELHTGPATGYPVVRVLTRGTWIELLKRRTDWFKVRDEHGVEGWVLRTQLEQTVGPEQAVVRSSDPARGDFRERRGELGALFGDFSGARALGIYGGYSLTPNLSGEILLSQAIGQYSSIVLTKGSLVGQPFPERRLSPFFLLSAGIMQVDPRATLVQPERRISRFAGVGVGLRFYLTRRFALRVEYNALAVFSASNDNDQNEDINEWKAGLLAFF